MVSPRESSHDKEGSSSSMVESTKKKVEWSSNLSSVESTPPDVRSPNWDSETDHLLSYFLGAEQQQENGVTSSPTQFTTTTTTTPTPVHMNGKSGGGALTEQRTMNHPFTRGAGPDGGHPVFPASLGRAHNSSSNFDDDDVPPPTPATQYYHHSSKPRKSSEKARTSEASRRPPASNNAAADNSIMKLKATLARSGAGSSSLDHPMESMSPLSPAGLIGPGHEELMLPPSPMDEPSNIRPVAADESHQQQQQQQLPQQQLRQSHLDWLEHINNLAKQANNKVLRPPVHAVAPPHPQHATMSYQSVPGMPALPVGYVHAPMFYAQAALKHLQQQTPAPESEEKRAKRLERNRESARKSRRRKKERLSLLEEKVAGLHSKIERARREEINGMNAALRDFFLDRVAHFDPEGNTDGRDRNQLLMIYKGTGPNCEVRRAVVDFQCSTLKQMLLPRYQKFLLWMTLLQENWYMAGKEQYTKRESGQPVVRITSGKISSKQVGDELTNGRKLEDGTVEPPPQEPMPNVNGDKANQTAAPFDPLRMWPLLCFELSISVDQEERIIHQAYKSVKRRDDLPYHRSQIEAATRMASGLKEAVLLQSHNAALRSDRTYLDILTPEQTLVYRKWFGHNEKRICNLVDRRRSNQRTPSPTVSDSNISENFTLIEVCRKLEEVLKISKGEGDETT